jgi:hypothetical protein
VLLSCWFLPRYRLANAPLRGLLSGLLSSLVQYVPPRFEYVSLVAGCLLLVDGHHSHFCRLDAAHQLLGMVLYPRFRVLCRHSANPYAAMSAGWASQFPDLAQRDAPGTSII